MIEKITPLVHSPIIENLQPVIKQVVDAITHAILEKRPILIRHHADTDGYAGALALQQAIMPLLYKAHTRERDMRYYYTRTPTLSPYYANEDGFRDVTNFIKNTQQFQHQQPLIILCDFGTSKQSFLAIQLVKLYGAKVIIIDHHIPDKEIEIAADVIVNPRLVGSDYDYCTGMLCAEIAHLLNPKAQYLEFLAAVAGYSDKVQGKEFDDFVALCNQQEITMDEIKEIGICLDYIGYELGNRESNELIMDLFTHGTEKQKELIKIIGKYVEERMKIQMETNLMYSNVIHFPDKIYVLLDLEKAKKQSIYPRRGKCVGILHDYMQQSNKLHVVTVGYSTDAMTFRCSTEIKDFSIDKIIDLLQDKLPGAQVEGGGHRVAGSISFISAAFEDVKRIVDEYVEMVK